MKRGGEEMPRTNRDIPLEKLFELGALLTLSVTFQKVLFESTVFPAKSRYKVQEVYELLCKAIEQKCREIKQYKLGQDR